MTRLDWLELQLEREDLRQIDRIEYEREANDLAEKLAKQQDKARVSKAVSLERAALIKARLLAGDLDVVEAFGIPEFGDNYEVVTEGTDHVVYSKVAHDTQDARWVTASSEAAASKLRQLVYYRMYDKYVRSGELSRLAELS